MVPNKRLHHYGSPAAGEPKVRRDVGVEQTERNMKIQRAAVVAGLLMLAAGCSSVKRIDAQTFLQHGKDSSLLGSATSYDVIGISHDRAYIQYDTIVTLSGRPATYVYWTPLSELPTNIVTDLRNGKDPWRQWWKTEILILLPMPVLEPCVPARQWLALS